MKLLSVLSLAALCLPSLVTSETEDERIAARLARGYQWPPAESDYKPNTPGWKKLFQHRLRQVEEIEDKTSRFEAYVQTLSASIVQPNYTDYGFGLARAPDDLMEALRQGIYDGLAAGEMLSIFHGTNFFVECLLINAFQDPEKKRTIQQLRDSVLGLLIDLIL